MAKLRRCFSLNLESWQTLVTVAHYGGMEDLCNGPEPNKICFTYSVLVWQSTGSVLITQTTNLGRRELKKTQEKISLLLANRCMKWQHPDSCFFLRHVSSLQCLPGKKGNELEAAELSSAPTAPELASDPHSRSKSKPLPSAGARVSRIRRLTLHWAGTDEAPGKEWDAKTQLPALAQDTGVVLCIPL